MEIELCLGVIILNRLYCIVSYRVAYYDLFRFAPRTERIKIFLMAVDL